jgi:PAS domain S-box-containing protein
MVFPYFIPLIAVSLLAIIASALITYRHRERRVVAGAILVIGAAIWLMMQAVEFTSSTLQTKFFFFTMWYVGIVIVPGSWLVLAMLISGYDKQVNKRNTLALTVVPLLTLLLVFTNGSHGLMFTNAALNPTDPTLPLVITFAPTYYVLVVLYSYALMVAGFVMIVRRTIATRSSFRGLGVQTLLAAMVPWVLDVAYVLDPNVFMNFEPSSLAISAAGVVLLWRIVKLPILGVLPVAHETLIDSMNEAIFVLDERNRIVDTNPKAQSLLGSTLSQTLGASIEKTWAEWPIIERALDSEAETGREVTLGDESDRRVYELQSSTIQGLIGNASYQLVTLRDITERKQMENNLKAHSERLEELVSERTKKLAESETRFRELADLLPQPVFEIDNEAKFTFTNRAGFALTGYTEEDMHRGVNAFDLVVEDDRERLAEAMMRVLGGENSRGYEFTVARKDGGTFPMFLYAVRVMRGNEIAGLRGIAVDIGERKRMEEALRESEDRLRTIFESVSAGIMIIDPKTHVIVDANPAAIEMAGAPKDRIVGSVCHKFVCPTEKGQCPITDLGQTIDYERERVLLRADGKRTSILKSVHITLLNGKEHLLESFIDISERKRMEEQLLRSERLASIGETTTMVGHDLRNPLQAMTGTLYLAKRLVMSEKAEDRKKAVGLLSKLDDAIQYMDKIVSDLQDYARPVGADPVEANLPDLVRATVSNVKIPGNVDVAVDVQDGSSNVRLDTILFRRVLANLVLNAIQAMPKGGRLTIAGSAGDGSLTVAVQDTGVGIAPASLEKIFNPFFTTKAQGQGLGLAVCKRLVEAQGGTITAKSQMGKGSTFTITIPQGYRSNLA